MLDLLVLFLTKVSESSQNGMYAGLCVLSVPMILVTMDAYPRGHEGQLPPLPLLKQCKQYPLKYDYSKI